MSQKVGQGKESAQYIYTRKDYIMTSTEANFFKRLERIAGDRYYIFPQIHLSSLLNNRVGRQSWRGALSHIQRKSVDYALVDRQTMKTAYAIELDDASHSHPNRVERDEVVNEIFKLAKLPLVRFSNIETLSDTDIEDAFIHAKAATGEAN